MHSRTHSFMLAILAASAAFAQPPAASTGRTPAPAAQAQPAPSPEIAAAEEAFKKQDWKAAVDSYKGAVAKGNGGGTLYLRLGYSLHMLKRYDEALECHIKTAHSQNKPLRIDGLYNAACASALLGKKDQAIEYFARAIDSGFADREQVAGDSDLEAIKSDPRFKTLVESIGKAPTLHQQLDFFLGSWSCEHPDGRKIEDVSVARPMSGSSAMVVTIQNAQGSQFTGLMAPNSADRTWSWVYSDNIGSTTSLTGTLNDSGAVRFTGRLLSPAGAGVHLRLTFSPQSDGSINESVEVSEDGAAWRTHHEAVYRKKSAAGAAASAPK